MSNVVSIRCTCDYLVKKASRHRRAGRYDEAMALLWKARNQFGNSEDVLIETAQIYDEIGCEEDAVRTYLRLVRLGGKYRAQALFQLSIYSAQHGDLKCAESYFDQLCQMKNQRVSDMISDEMLAALKQQLQQEVTQSYALNPRNRAKALEKHASACLMAGKARAAQRAMEHALRLRTTAHGYTMLACCQLLRMKFEDAQRSAEIAHNMSPGDVQTICVLADAYLACGNMNAARRMVYIAALRAKTVDALLSAAVESAKLGEDALTILLTGRILKAEPFHTRAMMIRACAHTNLHEYQSAKRLFARLYRLLPENSVCESYFKLLKANDSISERLTLGLDVTREEGIGRASELVSALYLDPKSIDEDRSRCIHLCRLADWAFRSPMAGSATKTVALLLMASLESQEAQNVLLDLMLDSSVADATKLHVLQVLTAKHGFHPYEVNMGGKLVRLAAGGISDTPVYSSQANTKVVQRVADALEIKSSHASDMLLKAFLDYLNIYGHPDSRHESVCSAALECWYLISNGFPLQEKQVAARYGVSVRNMRLYLRRFESCMQKQE